MLRLACLLALWSMSSDLGSGDMEQPGFKLVVHAENPMAHLSARATSDLFLKRVTLWPSGQPVLPVDQHETSPTRIAFTRLIHRRSVAAVRSYWQQMIFSGRAVPPAERTTDAEILEYVRHHRGAVGYVASSTATGAGVRVLPIH